ncbi:MAG TPA: hypothetical protein H9731_01280 [Candidatus Borkfalkia excrementipullorum]|nr:hypothetical protein [Candidatus Borkfalkia excrementipullorum]
MARKFTNPISNIDSLMKEWDWEKNSKENIFPDKIGIGSHRKVWWICNSGHEWQAQIKSRFYGVGCPVCANKIVVVGENDLASTCPDLAKEWHPTKNGNLTPQQVTSGSGKKVWWLCKNGHEFFKSIDARHRNPNCPICLARRRTSFPEQAIFFYIKQAFPDAINSYRDIFEKKSSMELDIFIPSIMVAIEFDGKAYHNRTENKLRDQKKFLICKQNHIFLIRISDTLLDEKYLLYDYKIEIPNTSHKSLDYAINNLLEKLGKELSIDVNRDRQNILSYLTSMDKSLLEEFPQIAEEWNYEKNAGLKPEMMHPGSNEKVWWKCSICGFEWKTSIVERTGPDKTGCPKCATIKGAHKHHQFVLRQKGSIVQTHHYLLEEWDYSKNTMSPNDVTAGSGKKVWWKCKKCGYSWMAAVYHRTNRGSGCPCCLNKVIVKGVNDLATTHPHLLKDWDYEKNLLKPDEIPAGTGKKVFWKCNICGFRWEAVCVSRARGAGCPQCANQKKYGNKYASKNKK